MTNQSATTSDEPRATIPRAEMDMHIAVGDAEQWTQPLHDRIPVAALLHGVWDQHTDRAWELRAGHWYVVREGAESLYELASPELATVLTDYLARLHIANDAVAQADSRSARRVDEGEALSSAPQIPEP